MEESPFRDRFPPFVGGRPSPFSAPFMHHETVSWYSPPLGRTMAMQVIGHAGARVLVFPTSMGTH